MTNVAIITARGGSKRIPRKNIKDFLGKPIIAYSIETALNSGLFDYVMVSTDDDEIAEVAKRYGAQVPFIRSKQTADDYSSTGDVLVEVIAELKNIGMKFDNACCIYPCAPMIKIEHLKLSLSKLKEDKVASSFPIVAYSYPIWRSLKLNENGFTEMNWSEYLTIRSQDLPTAYHDAGMFYFFKVDLFLQNKNLFLNAKPILLDETEVQDIDNLTDWKLAELKWKMHHA